MKIDKITIGGTIPVAQYANLMPEISMSDVSMQEAEKGLDYIKSMFARFSEKGALNEKPVVKVMATKKSFNEGLDIGFDPIAHVYEYDGKPLTAVTRYIDQFYKKFDSDRMSEVSAKAWGVEQKDVANLWEENARLSSDFGKVVHGAIEFYHKYKSLGNAISEKKGLEANYALPKHPVLRSIIEGYIAIDKSKGVIIPEALLTSIELGIGGHADMIEILNEKKKTCRIGDIKVNINSEEEKKDSKPLAPFDKLPANKLTKYQLQMSVYANLMEMSGWKVEGLDVYVYEDGWKHYKLDVLKVL